ncbi:mandelate racemase/muconate lactonizing enzyme family protein [Pseudoroseomonas cervicalis]|uniref:mandelate racemase/muconate lactonizing enzyme family protein n=1 Tax=Teichococcus cervicalis TaxID=204525 RepID=UPI0022F15D37|nr:mandelate racemase/muconate lactonizing enzyme family protein [Pseudoroseomonas cervicalis]WBV45200.1 mandelate racemase/muconate lactonizing enzyme family protein [Pseudoroseomonas cervicalis]
MSKITCLRTFRIAERPNLIWLEIETDEGLVGLGESFRGAEAVEAVLHEQVAPWLLGRDARRIEAVSRHLMTPYLGFHSAGAEIRAASAVDIALWDLAGQRHGIPVHEALGGACRTEIRAYNTCAGYAYNTRGVARRDIGAGDAAIGPYDDQIAFMRDAGALAESLLSEGYAAMKIWPFDVHAPASGGHLITLEQLKTGLEPFKKIRAAVGDRIEVMCELHSLWGAQAAERICRGLEDYGVFWAEDPLNKMDDAGALAALRRRTATPLCGSETLAGTLPFRQLLAADAIDVVMLDLAWCGGLTEGRKIAALAESHARPLAPHDCTGPVTLMAGLHLALHAPTAIFQEVVRATLATWYRDLVTELPVVRAGLVQAPGGPGLGTALSPALRRRPDLMQRESRAA